MSSGLPGGVLFVVFRIDAADFLRSMVKWALGSWFWDSFCVCFLGCILSTGKTIDKTLLAFLELIVGFDMIR